jgi:uncharacterized protein (TIGR02679 family)
MKTGRSLRLRQSELDAAFARAQLAGDLRNALELLDGPLLHLRARREAQTEAWGLLLERLTAQLPSGTAVHQLLADADAMALLKRYARGSPTRAEALLASAALVLARLPERGIPLARLAAETLGDAHALDFGRPVATLVLRAATGTRDPAVRARDRWAQVGVSVNELAAPVLCLNLGGALADGEASPTPVGRMLQLAQAMGEPAHVNLRALLREPPAWNAAGRTVFVCENPAIVAIAADRLAVRSAPLICTGGMPAAAQRTLLAQLAASGANLRYHGDFDWPGIHIGNFVMRAFVATPWRYGTAEYREAASAQRGLPLLSREQVRAVWDPDLAATMAEHGAAIHEEAVVEHLLQDLALA